MGKRKKDQLNTNIWTNTNIERYLQALLKCSVLWDETRCDFYNSKSKSQAYEKIAKELQLKDVDARECRKVFDRLKKIYAHRHRRPDDVQPAWFGLMDKILKEIACTKGKPKCLCGTYDKTCHKHCAKQNLESPCDYYRHIEKCKTCCTDTDQDPNKPHCDAMFPKAETVAWQNRYHMCEECCGRQNIGAPCADFYASASSIGSQEDKDPCKIGLGDVMKGCRIEYVKVAVILLDKESDDEDRQSDADEICCECSSSGSSSIANFCAEDQMTLPACTCKSDDACDCKSNPDDDDDDVDDDDKSDVRGGLFMDSPRFRGKPISLQLAEVVEPRRHFASKGSRDRPNDVYPLQLDM